MINRIHQAVRLLTDQNGVQDLTPEEIDIAINNASVDLFHYLLSVYRETRKLPDLLRALKRSGTGTISSDTVSLSSFTDIADMIAVSILVNSEEFPVEISRDDSQWLARSLRDLVPDKDNPDNPLHLYEVQKVFTDTDFTSGLATLPPYFLKALSVSFDNSSVRYPFDILTSEEYDQRKMAMLIRNKELPEDELFRFLERVEFTDTDFTDGKASLPANFVMADDRATLESGSNNFQWEKSKLDDWDTETLAKKIADGDIAEDELYRYLDRVTFTSGDFMDNKVTLPENTIVVGDYATLKDGAYEYQWKKVNSSEWDAKTIAKKIAAGELPEDELSWYETRLTYADTAFTNNKLTLPDEFVSAKKSSVFIDANGKEFEWSLANSEQWAGKSLIEKIKNEELEEDELHWYTSTFQYTGNEITAGKIELPADFVSLVSVATIVGGKRYEGDVVSNNDWDKREGGDVTRGDLNSRPLNVNKVHVDIPLSDTYGNLPDDFNEEVSAMLVDSTGKEEQVLILDVRDFNDRVDDVVTPPEKGYRICAVYDDKIRVYPGTDLESIRLYYYQKPTEKNLQMRVVGNEMEIYPTALSNGTIVEVVCRVYPSKQRSLYRINGNELELKSALATGESFTLDCYVCPTSQRGFFWAYGDTIEVKPGLSSGQSLVIPIYRFPTNRHGLYWCYGDTIEVKPPLASGEKLTVPMYIYPTVYRGQSNIYGSNIRVNPVPSQGTESIVMNYLAAITERAARCRIDNSQIEFLPSGLTNSIKAYYIKNPTVARWGYTVSGSDFVYAVTGGVNGDTIELDWNDSAYMEVLKRVLMELALPVKDQLTPQAKALMDRLDNEQTTLDLKGYGNRNA